MSNLDLNEYAWIAEAPRFLYEPPRAFVDGGEPRPGRIVVLPEEDS